MYTDIRYEAVEGIATVTISRPEVLNAVRPLTVEELIEAFHEAWADRSVGVVILTGAGDQAFCVGGDATARADDGGYKSAPGQRPARSDLGIDMEDPHTVIRDIPSLGPTWPKRACSAAMVRSQITWRTCPPTMA